MRDGRYLIPVKTEFRNKVSGFIVENSASRATVFMEPAAVRDANDKIKQIQLQIEEEVYRILAELSAKLWPHHQFRREHHSPGKRGFKFVEPVKRTVLEVTIIRKVRAAGSNQAATAIRAGKDEREWNECPDEMSAGKIFCIHEHGRRNTECNEVGE